MSVLVAVVVHDDSKKMMEQQHCWIVVVAKYISQAVVAVDVDQTTMDAMPMACSSSYCDVVVVAPCLQNGA